jgi:hypothetical protein
MKTITLHPFEIRGLGKAPFVYIGLEVRTTDLGQPSGCCDYCSNGIKYCCLIRSNDGKVFVVGTDCVNKLDHNSNHLKTPMELDLAKILRDKKNQERQKAYEEKRKADTEKRLEQEKKQREKNNGFTDAELIQMQEQRHKEERESMYTQKNKWVIDGISYANGDFVSSMIAELKLNPISSLSERCIRIIADIYAKGFGRGGSKKYVQAMDSFYDTIQQ